MISTQVIRNEMHAIDMEIRQLEDVLSDGDEEYEPVRLPLALKRPRRRILPRRDLEERRDDDPFWVQQAKRIIGAILADLLAKRKAVYRRLRAAYRHNSEQRKKGMYHNGI